MPRKKQYRSPIINLVDETHYPQCPFYLKEGYKDKNGLRRLYCDGAVLKFPDIEARRSYVYTLCAHPTGYKTCIIYKYMYEFFMKKYSEEGENHGTN